MNSYTPAYKRMLNSMGYYSYQNRLIHRHLNQEGGWDSHLAKSRDFILKTIDSIKPDHVTIYGSGWLLEVPVSELLDHKAQITLVDIVQPPDVRSQLGKYKNINIKETDVTGGLVEEIWKKTGGKPIFRKKLSLDQITIPDFKPEEDPGLVISVNLLTQLETQIVRHLESVTKLTEAELRILRSEIQKKHINFLKKYRSVLITDYEEVIVDKTGLERPVPTVLTDIPDAESTEKWTWDFDLAGSDYYNARSYMKVIGLIL